MTEQEVNDLLKETVKLITKLLNISIRPWKLAETDQHLIEQAKSHSEKLISSCNEIQSNFPKKKVEYLTQQTLLETAINTAEKSIKNWEEA